MVRCRPRNTLVGREPELAALAGLIGDVAAGRGRAAVMIGEAESERPGSPNRRRQWLGTRASMWRGSRLVGRHAVVLAMEAGADEPAG